ncbi:MAG: hypothetical protein Fur007_14590 [Rhodoferax sp.]
MFDPPYRLCWTQACTLRGVVLGTALALATWSASAQEAIYRCGNAYTNQKPPPGAQNCRLLQGGNVTIVQGPRIRGTAGGGASAASASASARVDSAEQRARDADARQILQAELQKTQSRLDSLLREYNNGQPERRGDEARNAQKYQARVDELKANVARAESDLISIRRELDRLSASR